MAWDAVEKVLNRAALRPDRDYRRVLEALELPLVAAVQMIVEVDEDRASELLTEPQLRTCVSELRSRKAELRSVSGGGPLELLWAIARELRPDVVVETGVALGWSSAVLLAALHENERGQLFSSDLPAFVEGEPASGAIVPDRLRGRWTLSLGPDRRNVPRLLRDAGTLDLAVYDSDKSHRGMSRTIRLLWGSLRAGGVMVVDDVETSSAFLDFVADTPTSAWAVSRKPGSRYFVGLARK